MELRALATNYLAHEPVGWFQFADQLVKRVAVHVAIELANSYGWVDEGEFESIIADALLPDIISPDFVNVVANSQTAEAASDEIIGAIIGVISSSGLRQSEILDESTEEIVDIGSDGLVVRSWDGFGTVDGPGGFSTFKPLQVDPSELGIFQILEAVIQDATIQPVDRQTQQSTPIIRLDVVDLALYRALLEHPDLLNTLNWRLFENLLADILAAFGYEVELQRGTKDGGIDIFAMRRDGPLGPNRYLLQAKRWSNRVGVEPVRQLLFLHSHYRATKSCLATTATFTAGAWELARQYQWQLSLRDFEGIQDWIRQAHEIKQREIANVRNLSG